MDEDDELYINNFDIDIVSIFDHIDKCTTDDFFELIYNYIKIIFLKCIFNYNIQTYKDKKKMEEILLCFKNKLDTFNNLIFKNKKLIIKSAKTRNFFKPIKAIDSDVVSFITNEEFTPITINSSNFTIYKIYYLYILILTNKDNIRDSNIIFDLYHNLYSIYDIEYNDNKIEQFNYNMLYKLIAEKVNNELCDKYKIPTYNKFIVRFIIYKYIYRILFFYDYIKDYILDIDIIDYNYSYIYYMYHDLNFNMLFKYIMKYKYAHVKLIKSDLYDIFNEVCDFVKEKSTLVRLIFDNIDQIYSKLQLIEKKTRTCIRSIIYTDLNIKDQYLLSLKICSLFFDKSFHKFIKYNYNYNSSYHSLFIKYNFMIFNSIYPNPFLNDYNNLYNFLFIFDNQFKLFNVSFISTLEFKKALTSIFSIFIRDIINYNYFFKLKFLNLYIEQIINLSNTYCKHFLASFMFAFNVFILHYCKENLLTRKLYIKLLYFHIILHNNNILKYRTNDKFFNLFNNNYKYTIYDTILNFCSKLKISI